MNGMKKFLLARFIPQRTLWGIGIGLLLVTGALEGVLASDVCSGEAVTSAVCGIAGKGLSLLGPWLFIVGVADQNRR